jgi:hypothetical protein
MSGNEAVTAATVGGALVWGLVLALWASLKREVIDRPPGGAPPRMLAGILNTALIPLTLLCGVLCDRFGVRGVLITGLTALAVALLGLSLRPDWPRNLVMVLLAGFGGAAVSVASVVLMPRALFPGETMPSVALGGVFVALGALVTSVLSDVLLASVGHKRTLAILAFLVLVPAFPAALAGEAELEGPARHTEAAALLGQDEIWTAVLVFFLYAPLEAAAAIWTTTTVASRTELQGRGRGLLAVFWVAFLVSRLATAVVGHYAVLSAAWDPWLLVLPALLAAVALGNLAGAGQATRLRLGVFVLGLMLGPIFPALAGVLLRRFQEEAGTAYGLLFAAGSLGSLLLASAARPAARPPGATRVPMFLALALTAAALAFVLTAA